MGSGAGRFPLHKELKYLPESVGKLLQVMDFHKLKFTCVLKAAERMFFCWKKQWPGCHLCLGRMMRVCRYLLNFPLNWVKFFLLENA